MGDGWPYGLLRTVRVDPFATGDLAREYNLSASAAWVLQLMAMQAEFRSGEWTGTLTVLTDLSRLGRNAAKKAVDTLIEKGLLVVIVPFRQGHDGRVKVVVRDRIVPPFRRSNRAPISQASDRDLTPKRGSDAIDQEEEEPSKASREEGVEVDAEGHCAKCGEPSEGHPFSDHEPVLVVP